MRLAAAGNEKSRASVNKVESACAGARHAARRRCKNARPRPAADVMSAAAVRPRPSAEASAGAAALPAQIGKYRILGRLGDGATSEVFLGYDDFQRSNVAIKRVRARPRPIRSTATIRSASSPPRRRWSAGCSTRTWSRSSTRCPTRSRPTWSWSTSPAATLRPYCRADQLLSLELIVEIGFKCAMALGYVYRQGLIHRDVKPAEPAGRCSPTARSPTSRSPISAAC